MRVKFHGHSTIELRIKNSIIYIDPALDPFAAEKLPKGDVILVSNASFDHCSVETIRLLSGENTIVLGTRDVSSLLHGCGTVKAGDLRDFGDFKIKVLQAVPYNYQKINGDLFGFGILAENKTLFYPSDTKYLHSMADIRPDIMLVAVGGTWTMNAKEAALFVNNLIPKIAIPIHFGKLNGTIDDAIYFKELVEQKQGTKVIILKEDEEVEI